MIWKNALEYCPTVPTPEESGWYYDEGFLMLPLITQEQVSAARLLLEICGCTRECSCCENCRVPVFAYRCAAPMPANVETFAETQKTILLMMKCNPC